MEAKKRKISNRATAIQRFFLFFETPADLVRIIERYMAKPKDESIADILRQGIERLGYYDSLGWQWNDTQWRVNVPFSFSGRYFLIRQGMEETASAFELSRVDDHQYYIECFGETMVMTAIMVVKVDDNVYVTFYNDKARVLKFVFFF